MSELKSMEISAADAVKFDEGVKPEKPKYPYGLSLNLEEDVLNKLDLKDLPEVDSSGELVAKIKVTSAGVHENKEGKRRHLNIQITHMALVVEDKKPKSLAEKLFKRHNPDDSPGVVMMEDN